MNPKVWLLVSLVTLLVLYRHWRQLRTRNVRQRICDSSLTGENYIDELMRGSDRHLFDLIRMKKDAFNSLCDHFIERDWLQDSKHVKVREKMCMFLRTLSHNDRNRVIQDRFQHSGQTISKYFHEVLWAMLKFSKEMIVPPNFNAPVEEIHDSNRRLREIFKGAVGALDGTLIHANVPKQKQIPYRGRGGGECWQNVLAICNFDMEFVFVVAGWEGTANDARILLETIRDPDNNFPTPPRDMYYLCDSAFTHTRGFMCPYKGGPRYWLPQFQPGGPARGKEEKFNHAHSKLRNVIERSFGVLKARFPILKKMPQYDLPTQRNIVIATMAIHNYLRRYSFTDDLFHEYENENVVLELPPEIEHDDPPPTANDIFRRTEQVYMKELREQIANQL